MKRIKIILLPVALLILSCKTGIAQNIQLIDSLKHELALAKQDTSKALLMVELCAQYRLGNRDSALYFGAQALALSRLLKYPKGEIGALTFLCANHIAMGNLPMAMDLGFKALHLAEINHLEMETSATLNFIGHIYFRLKDYEKALDLFKRQKIINERYPTNLVGYAYALNDLGLTYTHLNHLDSAKIFLHQAENLFMKAGTIEPLVYRNLGDLEMMAGGYEQALAYYHKGLLLARDNNISRSIAFLNSSISVLYKNLNLPDSSIHYARQGLAEAISISHQGVILETTTLLAELYEAKDLSLAHQYLKLSKAANESVYGPDKMLALQKLIADDQVQQVKAEAERIAYRNRLRQNAFLIGFVVLCLVVFLLYRNNRLKQRANILLQNQKEELDKQKWIAENALADLKSTQVQLIQSTKMASLGELTAGIAHEIQNPLNFVNNFSEINRELLDEMDGERRKKTGERNEHAEAEILRNIKENQEKILQHGKRADAIVKSMLEHSRVNTGQMQSIDLNALCDEYLRLIYQGLSVRDKELSSGESGFNAAFQLNLDPDLGKINVIPQDIGRVLLNLINNALWAISEKQKKDQTGKPTFQPKVTVTTRRLKDKVEIVVADNGIGIPNNILDKIFQPFFTTKPTGQGTGLGLSLSYDIVKAHGGSIKVISNYHEPGTIIVSSFNDPLGGELKVKTAVGEVPSGASMETGSEFVIILPVV